MLKEKNRNIMDGEANELNRNNNKTHAAGMDFYDETEQESKCGLEMLEVDVEHMEALTYGDSDDESHPNIKIEICDTSIGNSPPTFDFEPTENDKENDEFEIINEALVNSDVEDNTEEQTYPNIKLEMTDLPRKRGRPRKYPLVPKVVTEGEEKKRGRPKKKRGRPRVIKEFRIKKPKGRPRLYPPKDPSVKRPMGRPRLKPKPEVREKKPLGRPRKDGCPPRPRLSLPLEEKETQTQERSRHSDTTMLHYLQLKKNRPVKTKEIKPRGRPRVKGVMGRPRKSYSPNSIKKLREKNEKLIFSGMRGRGRPTRLETLQVLLKKRRNLKFADVDVKLEMKKEESIESPLTVNSDESVFLFHINSKSLCDNRKLKEKILERTDPVFREMNAKFRMQLKMMLVSPKVKRAYKKKTDPVPKVKGKRGRKRKRPPTPDKPPTPTVDLISSDNETAESTSSSSNSTIATKLTEENLFMQEQTVQTVILTKTLPKVNEELSISLLSSDESESEEILP